MSLLRYPGGKTKIKNIILSSFENLNTVLKSNYIEPFFGGGSIGLHLLELGLSNIWINDRDPSIACLWTSVIKYPEKLIKKIKKYTPTVKSFFKIRKELIELENTPEKENDIVDIALKKLAIHQISYSGLGTKSGGPLGGIDQKSIYKVNCRWSPDLLCRKINKYHALFSDKNIFENSCTNYDFETVIEKSTERCYTYIDPPYYHKGNDLYQFGFSSFDHLRLSKILKSSKCNWLLSYDDCIEIRNLYDWACVTEINVNYTVTGKKDIMGKRLALKKGELIIKRC